MKILIIEPEHYPREAEIEGGLESMQNTVGGYIQAVYPFDDPVALVCHEEGKLINLPLNRALRDESGQIYDIISGTFFICGLGSEDFDSMSPELMKKYTNQFAKAELFVQGRSGINVIPFRPIDAPNSKQKAAHIVGELR